jgi:hypothetical protein
MTQQSVRQDSGPAEIRNPILDLVIAGLEGQARAWQALHAETTRFVATRIHANLELLRKLAHCRDIEAMGQCHRSWLADLRKDYVEEWARIVGTTYAVGFNELAPMLCRSYPAQDSRSEPSPKAELQRQAA